jgi:predicted PurR-regulated permease PerM
MRLAHLNVYFLFLLLAVVGLVVYLIFKPFLTAILAAAILAALFQQPYRFLLAKTHGRHGWSSALTIVLIVAVVMVPIFVLLGVAVNEANSFFQHIISENTSTERFLTNLFDKLRALPYADMILRNEALSPEAIVNNLRGISDNILGFLGVLYRSVTHFIAWTFIMFFTLFYLLIDGRKALAYFMQISPLRNEHEKLLIQKFVSTSRAALKGSVMIGAIQGFLGGVTFAIAGVPGSVLWGLIMTLTSTIPSVGAGIIWLPAGLILLGIGQTWQGILVLVAGGGIISTIDNVLRPKVVGKDTQMHPLVIFFATLGGIGLFGLPGFVMGPIIVSLFLALAEIYAIEFKTQLQMYNE